LTKMLDNTLSQSSPVKWHAHRMSAPHLQFESPRPHHPMSDPITLVTSAARLQYKLCTQMHSVHNNRCPTYISDVVQSTKMASTRGGLRSAESIDFVVRWLRTKFAERGFSYAGPAAWNRLPELIRRTSSQEALK